MRRGSGSDVPPLPLVTGCTDTEQYDAVRTLCRLIRRHVPHEEWFDAAVMSCDALGLLAAFEALRADVFTRRAQPAE